MTVEKWYLIRHGETDFNKKRFFYGKADVSINETGKEQAALLHQLMKGKAFRGFILVSSKERKKQQPSFPRSETNGL